MNYYPFQFLAHLLSHGHHLRHHHHHRLQFLYRLTNFHCHLMNFLQYPFLHHYCHYLDYFHRCHENFDYFPIILNYPNSSRPYPNLISLLPLPHPHPYHQGPRCHQYHHRRPLLVPLTSFLLN